MALRAQSDWRVVVSELVAVGGGRVAAVLSSENLPVARKRRSRKATAAAVASPACAK